MSESKFRWQKNTLGGVTLDRWLDGHERRLSNGHTWKVQGYWYSIADVFKAKKGDRYVIRLLNVERGPGFHQYTAFTLREAMRLAKFIVGVKHGD